MTDVSAAPERRIVVLGVGNLLWADEGFGVRCVEALGEGWDLPPDVGLMDGGTLGLALVPLLLDTTHVLLFDAVAHRGEPGTLIVARDEGMEFALDEATLRTLSALPLPEDGRVRLGLRPEDLSLVNSGGIPGTLYGAEHHGAEIIAIIQSASRTFRVTIPADSRVEVNQPVQFSFLQDKLHFFHPLSGDNLRQH